MADEDQVLDGGDAGEDQKPDASVAAVKDIADQFTKALAEDRAARVAERPVAAAPTGPTPQEKAAELLEKKARVEEECNTLAAEGNFAAAAERFVQFQNEVMTATAGDPTDSPAYKAMLASARKDSKRDNADLHSKYGDEIEAEINSMAAGDRINPDAWDEALRRVKARHVDDIIQERLDAAAAEREKSAEEEAAKRGRFVAPVAPGSRGNRKSPEVVELEDNDLAAARMLGFSPEQYADIMTAAETNTIRKGWASGMHRLASDEKPKPGEF